MKKIYYLVFLIAAFIFVNECGGYKPIFSSENLKFKISNYEIIGDKKLGNKFYSKIYNLSKSNKDLSENKVLDLIINIEKTKSPTSNNSAGKILGYKIDLSVKITFTDFVTEKNILDQNFSSSLTYSVQDQYSDTASAEKITIENLINNTYREILIILSKNLSLV